jgi:hypothetical protein
MCQERLNEVILPWQSVLLQYLTVNFESVALEVSLNPRAVSDISATPFQRSHLYLVLIRTRKIIAVEKMDKLAA